MNLQEARLIVLERDAGTCVCCHHRTTTVHHRYRRGMGGTTDHRVNTPPNMVAVCDPDHLRAESLRLDSRDRTGLCIPNVDLAPTTPILTFSGWQLPTMGGTWLPICGTYAATNHAEAKLIAGWQGLIPHSIEWPL